MNWFYSNDGARKGPIDDATFRDLVANGTIRPDTLVWHEGMADWKPLYEAAPELADVPPIPYPAPASGDPQPGAPGAGASFSELKTWAKTGPKGNYWTFIGAVIVSQILLQIAGAMTAAVGALILAGPFLYGLANMSLRAADHHKLEFSDLFIGFNQFGRAVGYYCLTSIYIFLWSLLLVIPGIIKSFSYAMTPFVLLDHPEIGNVTEAINESRRLMDGNKWRFFCFGLSFIGWWLLNILTLGLLSLWLCPYQAISIGAFYRSVVAEKGPPRPAA